MEVSVEEPLGYKLTVIYTGTVVDTANSKLHGEDVIIFKLLEYDSITFIFTHDEFDKFVNQDLFIDGKGGECSICGTECDESNILNLQYDFYTFCDSCYKEIRTELEKSYDRNRSDIVSQLL